MKIPIDMNFLKTLQKKVDSAILPVCNLELVKSIRMEVLSKKISMKNFSFDYHNETLQQFYRTCTFLKIEFMKLFRRKYAPHNKIQFRDHVLFWTSSVFFLLERSTSTLNKKTKTYWLL